MGENNILVHNEKIVLWMGGIRGIYFDQRHILITPDRGTIMAGAAGCHYHDKLDWQLTVIRKIEELDYTVVSSTTKCKIYNDLKDYMEDGERLLAIFRCICRFIDDHPRIEANGKDNNSYARQN